MRERKEEKEVCWKQAMELRRWNLEQAHTRTITEK